MNIATICLALTNISFKLTNQEGLVSPMEFLLYRSSVCLAGIILPLYLGKRNPFSSECHQDKLPYLWFRSILGQSAYAIITFSLTIIPLSLNMIIFQTGPFWTSILGYLVNKEPILRF
jgi:drug/metabolite transporter (DMT)-like permease